MASPNLVSIVLPTYNREQIISLAIESVLKQTYQNFELIIVDDGSTDQTQKIIRKFQIKFGPNKIKSFYKSNGGQGSALNFGVEQSSGDIICFIDSDDQYNPEHLETLIEPILSKQSDFVMGSYNLIHDGPIPMVVDYYNPSKLISLAETEALMGVIAVKKNVLIKLGGFQGILVDIDLFNRVKSSSFSWKKIHTKTYNYHYGACSNSVIINYNNEMKIKGQSTRLAT